MSTESASNRTYGEVNVQVYWSDEEYILFSLEEVLQFPFFEKSNYWTEHISKSMGRIEVSPKGKEAESEGSEAEPPFSLAIETTEKLLVALRTLARVKLNVKKSANLDAEEVKTSLFRCSREDLDAPYVPNPVRKENTLDDLHDEVRDALAILTEGNRPALTLSEFLSLTILLDFLGADDFIEACRLQFAHLLKLRNRDEMIEMLRVPKSECYRGEELREVKKRNNWLIALERYDQKKDELVTGFPLLDRRPLHPPLAV